MALVLDVCCQGGVWGGWAAEGVSVGVEVSLAPTPRMLECSFLEEDSSGCPKPEGSGSVANGREIGTFYSDAKKN